MLDDDTLLELDELFGNEPPTYEELLDHPFDAVYSVATYYRGMIKLFIPNNPRLVLRAELESYGDPKPKTKKENKKITDEDKDRSLRLTCKTIRELMLSNDFEWFVTLTIGKDREDDQKSINKVLTWLKNQRARNGLFRYLIVMERHKSGQLHFHGVFGDYPGKVTEAINPKTNKPLRKYGRQFYNFPEYKSGHSTVKKIGGTFDDRNKVASYITKYISKELVAEFGKKRYWSSRKLNRPTKERNPIWYVVSPAAYNVQPDNVYEVPYGKVLTFYNPQEMDLPAYVKLLTE